MTKYTEMELMRIGVILHVVVTIVLANQRKNQAGNTLAEPYSALGLPATESVPQLVSGSSEDVGQGHENTLTVTPHLERTENSEHEYETVTQQYFDLQTDQIEPDSEKGTSGRDGYFAERHRCGFIDSCIGRCGSAPSDSDSIFSFLTDGQHPSSLRTSYACFCDALCSDYNDCCRDYDRYCQLFTIKGGQAAAAVGDETDYFDDVDISGPEETPENEETTTAPVNQSDDLNDSSFECVHIGEVQYGSLWMRSKCHPAWQDSYIEFLCNSINYNDDLAVLLVQGPDGKTYRNIFCAQCNFIDTAQFWILDSYCYGELPKLIAENSKVLSMYLLTKCVTRFRVPFGHRFRPCLKTRDTCPSSSLLQPEAASLKGQCESGHQSFVTRGIASVQIWGSTLYRNAYCAKCNGVDPVSIACPTTEELQEHFLNNSTVRIGALLNPLIARKEVTCRIVTNYNTENAYSSTLIYEEKGSIVPVVVSCDEGMVFDPYLGECRQLYCSSGYVLAGQECKPIEATDELDDDDIIRIQNAITAVINETVGLDEEIVVTIKLIIELDENGKHKGSSYEHTVGLPHKVTPVLNRTDWDIYITPVEQNTTRVDDSSGLDACEVTMTLVVEDPSAINRNSAGNLVSLLEKLANLNNAREVLVCLNTVCLQPSQENFWLMMDMTDGNMTDLNYLVSRCKNGNITMMDSSEFSMQGEEDSWDALPCPTLYVNSTADLYACTDTYIFGYDPAKPAESQSFGALVCDSGSPLDPSCELLLLNDTEYEMLRNGSILVYGVLYDIDEYHITPRGIEICNVHSEVISVTMIVFFDFSDPQKIILYIGLIVSTSCLLLTLITYMMFGELRTIPGLHRMSLMIASIGGNITMLIGVSIEPGSLLCQVTAILTHMFFLTRIFWTNAILIHSFHTFGTTVHKRLNRSLQVLRTRRPRSLLRQYAPYSLYAWGTPLIFIALGGTWHFCSCGPLPIYYGTYFSCWIADPLAFLYLFIIPLLVLLIANGVLYALTVYSIQQTAKNSGLQSSKDNGKTHAKVAIYLKLSTTAGFCWMFAIIAAFTGADFLWYIFVILMSLEGMFIFFSFFCTKRTKTLYSKRVGAPISDCIWKKKSSVYAVSEGTGKKSSTKSTETFVQIDI